MTAWCPCSTKHVRRLRSAWTRSRSAANSWAASWMTSTFITQRYKTPHEKKKILLMFGGISLCTNIRKFNIYHLKDELMLFNESVYFGNELENWIFLYNCSITTEFSNDQKLSFFLTFCGDLGHVYLWGFCLLSLRCQRFWVWICC